MTIKAIKRKYTRQTKVPKTRNEYRVWLRVEQQSFMLANTFTKTEADWTRQMMATALAKLCLNET